MIGIAYGMGSIVRQFVQSFADGHSPVVSKAVPPGTEYLNVNELGAQMAQGRFGSADLVTYLQERIRRVDPKLKSIIELNPKALETARELDRERASGNVRGLLHGIPVLLKDTIETEGMQTSAGAFGLVGAPAGKNAPLVDYLIKQGAVILGKTNMTELAGFRGGPDGWSSRGGKPVTHMVRMPTSGVPVPGLPSPSRRGWRPWRWELKPVVRLLCQQRAMGLSGSSPALACWTVMELFLQVTTRILLARWRVRYLMWR